MSNDGELTAALALLHARIAEDVATQITPGLSIAVVRDQEMVWADGFGYATIEDAAPATPATVYAIGSITKLFTATMLMRLRDAGKLRLDDPVQDYVPNVRVPRRHPDAPPITFRHLVTHTAGLPKDAPLGYWAGYDFPSAPQVMDSLAECDQPYPPGTQWKYSNLGFALLGFTLSRIAEQPWEQYIQEHILDPLEMASTAPRFSERLGPVVATGYHRPVDGWPPRAFPLVDIGGIGFGGSMHASVVDMATFMAEQFSPTPRLLKRNTIEEMQRIQWLNPDWQSGRGMPWAIQHAAAGTRIGHGGGVYGFTCQVQLSPADKLGVAVFTNGSDGSVAQSIATWALDLLVDVTHQASSRRRVMTPTPVPAAWWSYAGRYRWFLGDADIVIRDGQLLLLVSEGAATETVPLDPVADADFWMPTGPQRGELLRFILGDDRRVRRVWVGPHPYDPV